MIDAHIEHFNRQRKIHDSIRRGQDESLTEGYPYHLLDNLYMHYLYVGNSSVRRTGKIQEFRMLNRLHRDTVRIEMHDYDKYCATLYYRFSPYTCLTFVHDLVWMMVKRIIVCGCRFPSHLVDLVMSHVCIRSPYQHPQYIDTYDNVFSGYRRAMLDGKFVGIDPDWSRIAYERL